MKKRIFDLTRHDIENMKRSDFIECIRLSEGRTLMVENVVTMAPPLEQVSGAEIAAAFGADMITLNFLDLTEPKVRINAGAEQDGIEPLSIPELKKLTGRIIGCNLEPVPSGFTDINAGRSLTKETVEKAVELGLNYIMLTGNPGMMVSQETILDAIALTREVSKDIMIIAGKMHGGGVGNDYNLDIIPQFAEAGADIMMFPAPYTTPGMNPTLASTIMNTVHEAGMLGLLAIGTSQEGASESFIEKVAFESKGAGADIVHIGDGGYGGIAIPENIMRMGITIRGRRHQFKRMANRR